MATTPTNALLVTHVCARHHSHAEIVLHFADDLDRMSVLQMSVLRCLSTALHPEKLRHVLTLLRCMVMSPSASIVAESPRIWRTLPMMRTFWWENCSRYLALILGVASMFAWPVRSGNMWHGGRMCLAQYNADCLIRSALGAELRCRGQSFAFGKTCRRVEWIARARACDQREIKQSRFVNTVFLTLRYPLTDERSVIMGLHYVNHRYVISEMSLPPAHHDHLFLQRSCARLEKLDADSFATAFPAAMSPQLLNTALPEPIVIIGGSHG